MPNENTSGIITLKDLSAKEIYLELDNESTNYLMQKIRDAGNISKFLKINSICYQNFWDWWIGKSCLRLDIFTILIQRFPSKNIKVAKIRGKQGSFLSNPEMSFDFTTDSGIRLIASILGDGCIHDKGVRYVNKNKHLIDLFLKDAKNVFGSFNYKVYKDGSGVYSISLPEICKKIVTRIGLCVGSKITNAQKIPPFIFSLEKNSIYVFISKLIDDEGYFSNGRFGLDMAFAYNEKPHLLIGMNKLLKLVDIDSKLFKVRHPYKSSRGIDRQMWRLAIFSYCELEKLCCVLNLTSEKKSNLTKSILHKRRKTPIKNINTYLTLMGDIEKTRGFFTLKGLSMAADRSERQTYRVLLQAQKAGLIKTLEAGKRSVASSKCKVL